jgi:hypothetical protein
VADLIDLLKEASHPRAAIQPRTDSLALAVAARAAQGRAWLQKCDTALRSIQVRVRRAGTQQCSEDDHSGNGP